jgi:DNA-binding MarR family transcriptional regulator
MTGDAGESRDVLLLDEQLCFAIYSAGHAFNRVYKPLLDRLGLTYPQYLVMLVLWQQDGMAVKAIGDRLQLDSGTLTPLLKRLEAAGLVSRLRSAADERQVQVTLTAAGRSLHETACMIVPAELLCATGGSQPDNDALRLRLVALRDRLNAAAG